MVLSWSSFELVLICIVIIIVILLTIIGNLIVLFAFYSDPHLLTPSNKFLLSMAIADLLVGLISMPFHSYAQIKGMWPFGKYFCKVWLTIDDVATMASVLSIVAITIERYWSINHSVHYRRYTTKHRVRIVSILIWLIPFLNFAPGIWILQTNQDTKTTNTTNKTTTECIGAYHSNTLYLIIAQINFFAWPLFIIITLNALIVVNLYRRSHRFPSLSGPSEKTETILPEQNRDHQTNGVNYTVEKIPTCHSILHTSHMLKSIHLESQSNGTNNNNHYGSILPSMQEIDEQIIEEDIVNLQPHRLTPKSVSVEIDTKQSFSSSSSSNLYGHFKHILLSRSSDSSSSKSVQALQALSKTKTQKSHSLFSRKSSSLHLSVKTNSSTASNGEHRNVRRLRRDKRAATSLLTLVLVFMIFLLPYVVVVVTGNIFSLELFTDTNGQIYSAAFWLLWLNSTVNPILYPFIQPKFRDAYRKIFLRLTRRRPRLFSLITDMHRDK